MQTFLPYPSFTRSARALDYRRLGKQRIEAKQILNAITNKRAKGWRTHPAALMWKGHEYQLACYGIAMCIEWRRRGYVDNQLAFFNRFKKRRRWNTKFPAWLGSRQFHRAHKSNLLRKDRKYYKRHGWNVSSRLPYVWPVSQNPKAS